MILFHAKANGQVTTTPSLVPQGSSMQDLVVLSELDYALCTIKLEPASGIEIPDVVCTFIKTERDTTLWTAKLPPEAAKVPGKVTYSLEFTAADGTVQPTLSGSFTVPRRAKTTIPENVDGLKQYTINELFVLLSDIYASMAGSGAEIDLLMNRLTSQGTVTIDPTQWTNTTPFRADVFMPGDVFGKGCVVLFAPADDATKDAAGKAMMSMTIGGTVDQNTPSPDYVVIARAESGTVPTIPLNFRYVVLKTGTEDKALVAMVGVDATGDGGGLDEEAVKDLINEALQEFDPESGGGGLTDLEVRLIINEVVPKWALQQTAPVTSVNNKTGAVTLSASGVGADAAGTAATKVSEHDTYTGSHQDIRLLIKALQEQVNKFLDVDDTARDELSEVLALIDANADTLESLTSGKVNVTDIVNNLTTNVSNKPLSAAQGVALKKLIDALSTGKLDASALASAINTALAQAEASGAFKGDDGISPVVSVTEITGGHRVSITDKTGTKTFDVMNGEDGASTEEVNQMVETAVEDVKGEIVQDIIKEFRGLPVFGVVDENNTITVTSLLADGTYSLKYENEDGTTEIIGTITVGTGTGEGTGGVTTTEVNIAAIGYTDNARWSVSSGDIRTGATGYTAINLIPIDRQAGETITLTLSGITWNDANLSTEYAAVLFYVDDTYENNSAYYLNNTDTKPSKGIIGRTEKDGAIILTISDATDGKHYNGIKLCGVGSGANAKVTITK